MTTADNVVEVEETWAPDGTCVMVDRATGQVLYTRRYPTVPFWAIGPPTNATEPGIVPVGGQ